MSLYNDKTYQLIFEGTVGPGFTGDMAIDDVIIQPGKCQPYGGCNFDNVGIVLHLFSL